MEETTGILAKLINGELHFGSHIGVLYHAIDYIDSEVDGWKWFSDIEAAKEYFNINT